MLGLEHQAGQMQAQQMARAVAPAQSTQPNVDANLLMQAAVKTIQNVAT